MTSPQGQMNTYTEQNPNPILNMGVEIHKEWSEEFWEVSSNLKLTAKQTINWIINYYMKNRVNLIE